MARVLTSQAEDFPRWYQDVVAKAELAEPGPVRGSQVIRPVGLRDLGAHGRRDGRPDQGRRRAERVLPAAASRSPTCAARPSTSRASPGAGGGHPRRRQAARRAGRDPADQRDGHRRVHGQVGRSPIATCRCCSTSGATCVRWEMRTRLFLRSHRVPLAGGPHRARHRGGGARTTPAGSCTRRTRTSWSTCWPCR